MDFKFNINFARLTTNELKEKEIELFSLNEKYLHEIKKLDSLIKKENSNKTELRNIIYNTDFLTSYLIEKKVIDEKSELTQIQIFELGISELNKIDEKIKTLQDKLIENKTHSKNCKDAMDLILQIYWQRQNPIELEPTTSNLDDSENKTEFPFYKKSDFALIVINDYLKNKYASISQSCKANFKRYIFNNAWNWTEQKAYDTTKKYYLRNYKQV